MWELIELKNWTEPILREFLKENIFPEMTSYTQMSRVDDHTNDLEIELKCRKETWLRLMIQRDKFEALYYRAQINKRIPVYICSTPAGVKLFDLYDGIPQWEDRDGLPVSTEFENKNKIVKTVGYLNADEGVDLLVSIINQTLDSPLTVDEWM